MKDKEPRRFRRIPLPKTQDTDELRAIARTQLFAPDTRILVIENPVRGNRHNRWNSDHVRKHLSDKDKREKLLDLVVFQMSISKRRFVFATFP